MITVDSIRCGQATSCADAAVFSAHQTRFTLDGSHLLEERLDALCRQVRQAVLRIVSPDRLEALVLGGGYGRGQGGVLKTAEGDAPYNDLEFYVFVVGNRLLNERRYRRALEALGESLSPSAGLHVEFKIDSLAQLERRPVSIFSYDLVSGHRVVYGPANAFQRCQHHLDPTRILPTEAARLLLNRCSGLLLAKEMLLQTGLSEADCDFIGRNLAKAKLALGDALLACRGEYHWNCLERERRLAALQWPEAARMVEAVRPHHSAGVSFKLHPVRVVKSIHEFGQEGREVTRLAFETWLWIENHRLPAGFSTLRDYCLSPQPKCEDWGIWRNLLLNLRVLGLGAMLNRFSPRYPRERLFNALPLLLGDDVGADQLRTKRHLQRQLGTRADDWQGLVVAYKQIWSCYG